MIISQAEAQLCCIGIWQVGGLPEILQGSTQHTLARPRLVLSTAIDKRAGIWTAIWQAEPYLAFPPSVFFYFSIEFEDTKGFYRGYDKTINGLSYRGTMTIGYVNRGVWAICSAHWIYCFWLGVEWDFCAVIYG